MNIQLNMNTNLQVKSCAFTGHREVENDLDVKRLNQEIEALIKRGVDTFYNGMARGFDLIAAKEVLKLKKKYKNVKLIACIPYYGQEKYFDVKDKKAYQEVLKKADLQTLLSPVYYKGCELRRDEYMADRADVLITYLRKTMGGTAYTVRYFTKKYPYKEKIEL